MFDSNVLALAAVFLSGLILGLLIGWAWGYYAERKEEICEGDQLVDVQARAWARLDAARGPEPVPDRAARTGRHG